MRFNYHHAVPCCLLVMSLVTIIHICCELFHAKWLAAGQAVYYKPQSGHNGSAQSLHMPALPEFGLALAGSAMLDAKRSAAGPVNGCWLPYTYAQSVICPQSVIAAA